MLAEYVVPHKDYSHRDVVDKLGIKTGHRISIVPAAGSIEPELLRKVLERSGRLEAGPDESPDVVLATVDADTDATALMREWRGRIQPAGGIWLLTPKRNLPGYIDQNVLIALGPSVGLVDNKTCSVSDTTSGIRFVIRRADRLQ